MKMLLCVLNMGKRKIVIPKEKQNDRHIYARTPQGRGRPSPAILNRKLSFVNMICS